MKKYLAYFLMLIMAISLIPQGIFTIDVHANTETKTYGDFTYTVSDGYATIIDFSTDYVGHLEIPYSLGGYTVTCIGKNAFEYCDGITSIDIPDSIVTIDEKAFHLCTNLSSPIVIPDSVTFIGIRAFASCSKAPSFTINNSVTTIGDEAFYGCSSLTTITIPNSITIINNGVFSSCSSLIDVNIPNSVTHIGDSAFAGCSSITNIDLPNSVTHIGNSAFEGCSSITSIDLPNSVTHIGDAAFSFCSSLTAVNIPNSVLSIGVGVFLSCTELHTISVAPDSAYFCSDNGVLFNKNKTTLIQYSGENQDQYTIPDSVATIGDYAFAYSNVTSIIMPDSVTSIGHYAFSECHSLMSATLGDAITSIGDFAFCYCENLTSINIPNSVTYIGHYAFCGSNLTSINIPDSVTSIGVFTFAGCPSLVSVTLGDAVSSIGAYAFYRSNLSFVLLPSSLTYIGEGAFYLTGLTDIWYTGTPTMRDAISPDGNEYLLNIPWHYNTCTGNHLYSFSCDASCNQCDWIRNDTGEHSYSAECDPSCNQCGEIRATYTAHTYSSKCDISCNQCDWTRTVIQDHLYDNACDLDCNNCGFTRNMSSNVEDHVFDHDCDLICNRCEFTRTMSSDVNVHVFDNACDLICNRCEFTRTMSLDENDHLFDHACDTACNRCSFTREITHTYTDDCDDTCNVCQSVRTPKHTYDNSLDNKCNLCYHIRTANEYDVLSITIDPITVIENYNVYGNWRTDSNGIDYFHYNIYSGCGTYCNDFYIHIQFADNITFDGTCGELYKITNGNSFSWFTFASDQAVNHWGIGDHIATVSFLNATCQMTVTVKENPVQSISVESISIVEGTHGYTSTDRNGNSYYEYHIFNSDLYKNITIYYKDGTSFTGTPQQIYNLTKEFSMTFSANQRESHWSVGDNTATASYMGITCNYTVTITESPIASIYAAPITLYENVHSAIMHDYSTNTDYYRYSYNNLLSIAIFYKDGTIETGIWDDMYNRISIVDDQSATSLWGLGKHKATVRYGHLSCEVDITIKSNPVKNIELIKSPKIEYITGEMFDLSGAVLRVHFNDNTSEDISILHYFTYPNHSRYFSKKLNAYDIVTVSGGLTRDAAVSGICFANAGEQTLTLTYFGQSTTLPVTVTEKIIKDISINDDNKNLIVTVTYTDNSTQEMTAHSFISSAGEGTDEYAAAFGELRTDKGIYYATFSTYTDSSMSLSMNGVSSNILENGCDWYSLYIDRYNLLYNESYSNMASNIGAFNGIITADNIDSIICYILLLEEFEWTESDPHWNGNYWYYGQDLRDAILKHFAVDSVDLSLSSYYDSEKDLYPCLGTGAVGYETLPATLTYENGYWEACWPMYYSDEAYSYARFDDEGRILRFSAGAPITEPSVLIGDAEYDSFEEALNAAVAGQTITLNADVVATGACTMLGADVTLDLNGHSLTVSNFITFGDVVDSTEGEGKLIISDDPTKAFTNLQENNSQMPLYDEDGYRFFRYSVLNRGTRTAADGKSMQFGTHVQLANRKAYELLTKEKNGNTAITFHITYQGQTFDYTFKAETLALYGQTVCDKYDNNVADKTGTVLVLTVIGFDPADGAPDIHMEVDYHSTRTLVHKKQSIH